MKYLFAAILILLPALAQAQKTCSPVTAGVSQNCLVTITVVPGAPSSGQIQADSFQIRRSDAGGAKTVIGTTPLATLTIQHSFTDAGNVDHCFDAVSVKSGLPNSTPSPEQCWTTPALAPVTVTTPGGLTLSAISSTTIRITWDATSDNTELYGRPAKGPKTFNRLISLVPDVATWDWTNLKRYSSFCAKVRAVAGTSYSDFSNVACATTSK